MGFKFQKGDKVIQIPPVLVTGEVGDFELDREKGEVSVRVDWTDEDGNIHQRFFKENEIQAVK